MNGSAGRSTEPQRHCLSPNNDPNPNNTPSSPVLPLPLPVLRSRCHPLRPPPFGAARKPAEKTSKKPRAARPDHGDGAANRRAPAPRIAAEAGRQAGVGADRGRRSSAPFATPPPSPIKKLDPAHCSPSLRWSLALRCARVLGSPPPPAPIRLPGPVSAPESFPSSRSAAAPPPPGSRVQRVGGGLPVLPRDD
ncbi:hypothetical protein PVAP13_5NG440580 [Panicum virgatum]|uniref:Uncharacterized protein n=1 Tax=Panicum virgatum TaxID=38727 RepID=A0A8T0S0H2_PANVG|nr:hypothetical protein PVAP13_5NG440580 [Panicum virgatum]